MTSQKLHLQMPRGINWGAKFLTSELGVGIQTMACIEQKYIFFAMQNENKQLIADHTSVLGLLLFYCNLEDV